MLLFFSIINTMFDDILNRIDQKKVLESILNIKINIDEYITSPFRKDSSPGCKFTVYNNKIHFVDYSKKTFDVVSVDIVEIVKYLLQGTYFDAKRYLENNFLYNNNFNNPIKYEKADNKILKKRLIDIYPRKINDIDLSIWKKWGISEYDLKEDRVFPIKNAIIYSKKGSYSLNNNYMYCFYEFKPYKKIYIPYPLGNQRKFYTDTDSNFVGSIDHYCFKHNDYIIITKSYKDCRILRNFGFNSVWFQSESQFPKDYVLEIFLNDTDNIYILFDNDQAGIKNSFKLYDILKEKYPKKKIHSFFLPKKYNLTDCGDYYEYLLKNNTNANILKNYISNNMIYEN